MDDPILRPKQAMALLGIKRSALYAWVKSGLLVKPIKLGRRATGWRKSQLDAFIEERRTAEQAAE